MLKPGDKVTSAEIDRIEALRPDQAKQDVAQMVQQSGRTGNEAEMLTHLLSLFYDDPDRYQRVPGIESDFRLDKYGVECLDYTSKQKKEKHSNG